jgi:hypothetical protein
VLSISESKYKEPIIWSLELIHENAILEEINFLSQDKVLTCKQMRESACKIIYMTDNLN